MLLGAFNIENALEGIFNKENFRDCETSNFAKVRFQLYCTDCFYLQCGMIFLVTGEISPGAL